MFKVVEEKIAAEKATLDELNQVEHLVKRVLGAENYRYHGTTSTRKELCFRGGIVEIGSYDGGYISFRIGRLSYDDGLKLAAYLNENIRVK